MKTRYGHKITAVIVVTVLIVLTIFVAMYYSSPIWGWLYNTDTSPIVLCLYNSETNIGNLMNAQLYAILLRMRSHSTVYCYTVCKVPIFATFVQYRRENLALVDLDGIYSWENATGDYWVQVAPILQTMVSGVPCICSATPDPTIIIHFRCADVPFNRHNSYEFAKYRFYTDIIQAELAAGTAQRVVIIYNNQHLSNPTFRQWGNAYVEALRVHIVEVCQTEVCVESGTILEDFQRFRCAQVLISGASSMSFMAAMVNHHKAHIMESAPRYLNALSTTYPEHVTEHPRDVLSHELVADYGDINTVCSLLAN